MGGPSRHGVLLLAICIRVRGLRTNALCERPLNCAYSWNPARWMLPSGSANQARDLVKRVLQLGYQTSTNPENLLYSVERVLEDEQLFRAAGRGLYELALSSPKRRKVGRPNRRAKRVEASAPSSAAKEEKVEAVEQPKTEPAEVKGA